MRWGFLAIYWLEKTRFSLASRCPLEFIPKEKVAIEVTRNALVCVHLHYAPPRFMTALLKRFSYI